MSQFMPDEQPKGQTFAPPKGPEEYLSPDERKFLGRYLSFPEDIPPRFKSWLIDFIAVNIPQIPISQVTGFKQVEQVEVFTAEVLTSQTTTSTSYTNLGTVGPEKTGLRAGQYLILFGSRQGTSSSGTASSMSVSINGAAASDNDQAWSATISLDVSVSRAVVKNLALASNTITCKYRAVFGGTSTFTNRWLVAQRIGPAT